MAVTGNTYTHGANYIDKIKIGTTEYEICDAKAFHSIEEIGLGNVFTFKGVANTVADLKAVTGAVTGDVYLVTDTKTEYVYKDGTWYEFGGMHSHNHTASHNIKTAASAVNVNTVVKEYSPTYTTITGSASKPGVTTSTVLGDGTTVSISGGKGVNVVSNTKLDVNVSTSTGTFVSGVTVGTAANAISDLTTGTVYGVNSLTQVNIPQFTFNGVTASYVTMGDDLSIPNVTGVSSKTASKATKGTDLATSLVTATNSTASKVTFGTAFSIPHVSSTSQLKAANITSSSTVTASKAATATAISALNAATSSGNATAHFGSVSGHTLTLTAVNAVKGISTTTTSIPQYTFTDVNASSIAYNTVDVSKVTMGTAFSVPNVSATNVSVSAVNITPVNVPQYTFADVSASAVTLGTAFSVPYVASVDDVEASKATAGTNLVASKINRKSYTFVNGVNATVPAIPSVTVSNATALTGASASLVTGSADADAVTVITGVTTGSLTATITPENIAAVTGVNAPTITLTNATNVVNGITATNVTKAGSGTAAAQTISGTVTINTWGDSNQEVTPNA